MACLFSKKVCNNKELSQGKGAGGRFEDKTSSDGCGKLWCLLRQSCRTRCPNDVQMVLPLLLLFVGSAWRRRDGAAQGEKSKKRKNRMTGKGRLARENRVERKGREGGSKADSNDVVGGFSVRVSLVERERNRQPGP